MEENVVDHSKKLSDSAVDKILALSEEQKRQHREKNPNWFDYVKMIVLNLITLGIVIGIYGKISNEFIYPNTISETIVNVIVSILFLIYLSLQDYYISFGEMTGELVFALDKSFNKIRGLLNNKPSEYEIEEMQSVENNFEKSKKLLSVNSIFLGIIYCIVIYKLLASIVS